ncbi:MAG: hypothetical protein WCP21_12880, partial [Armatimonadota bacterium]
MHLRCLALALLPLVATPAFAATGVTFYASFDHSVIPEVALGGRRPIKVVGFAADRAGTGKVVPSPKNGTGKFGGGLVLDGSSYVEYPAGANLGARASTIALWFKPLAWGAKTYDNIFGPSDTDRNGLH